MKIAWATPFNRKSAIGRDFSGPIARELMLRGHDVEIIRTELQDAADLPAVDFEGRIHRSRVFVDLTRLESFDVVAVNWGDCFPQHGGALALAGLVPTVAILHDADMRNFAIGASKFYNTPVEKFSTVLPPTYRSGESELDSAPVLAWFAALSASAVVHDRRSLSLVQTACPGPVCCVPKAPTDQAEYPSCFAKGYVDAILPLIDQAIASRPLFDAGLQFGAILEACGARLDEPAIRRIGAVIDELYGPTSIDSDLPKMAPGEQH
jgi:hypothetical protein